MSQSTIAPGPPPPRLEFNIPPRGSHLLRARERLRDYLTQYCAQRELIDDVVLCIEEACTNAIRHSGSDDDIAIGLEFGEERLVAFVRDTGRGFDVARFTPALPDLMADHGRGLYIIASLMDDLELCCEGGCQVRMSRSTAARVVDQTVESGLGEVRLTASQRDTRLRSLLEEIGEAFVALDWEYRCVHANTAALQFVGKSLDEAIGLRPCELAPELAGSALERSCREAMELGRPAMVEHRLESGVWLEVRLYPTSAGVSAYFRRIDDRKRTEQERERLLAAYRVELSRSTLLRDVARAATSSLGLDEICSRVLEQIHAHADLRGAAVRMVDWERRTLRALAVFGDPGDEATGLDEAPLAADGICGRLLASDLPELSDAPDPRDARDAAGPAAARTTWLALPIVHQGETLGAMMLSFAEPTLLDGESLELYHSVAATLGAAMAHARSFQHEVEAQEALRRYQLLAAEARDIMLFVRRRDGRILEANRAAEAAYGYSRDELLELTIRDLRASETVGEAGDQMAAAALDGVLFETVHRRRDGTPFPVEVSSRGTTAMSGEVVLLSIVRDITNRLAAQRALRDSEDRYRSLVDMSPEAILVHVEGRLVFANPAAAVLLGADSADELLGKAVFDLIHPDHRAAAAERIEQARLGHVTPLQRMRWMRLDGETVHVEVTGTGIEYGGVPAVQIIVGSRDEQARAEAALRDSERRSSAELVFSNTLLRAADALSSSMQIDTLLDRLAELLIDAVAANRLVVLLWDRMENELSVAVAKGGPSLPVGASWGRRGSAASPIVARLVADRHMKTIDFEDPGLPRRLRQAAARRGLRLALALPIVTRGELLGYVAMDESGARRQFDEREIRLAKAICEQAGAALDNARLYQQEHDVAQILRAALLKLPDSIAGLAFAHHYHTAARPAHVGGDFYDLFELDHGLVGMVVGDISGKGIQAAVLTSLVKNTIRAHATERGKTPAQVVALTNTVLTRETAAETFATLFFGMLDRRDGRLVYCNAGHPATVVVHADGGVAVLPPTAPLIGAFPTFTYRDAEAYLSCDDLLFLYTDGLTEARNGRRLFGERRLFDALAEFGRDEPGAVVDKVIETAVSFAQGGLHDDLAVLAVRRSELPGPSQQKLRLP